MDGPDAVLRPKYRNESWAHFLSITYGKYLEDEQYDFEADKDKLEAAYDSARQENRDEIMRNTEETERLKVQYNAMGSSGVSLLVLVSSPY